jgi:hypothetical protein
VYGKQYEAKIREHCEGMCADASCVGGDACSVEGHDTCLMAYWYSAGENLP